MGISIHNLLASRHSGRSYDPNRKVQKKDLQRLIEAARWAPSCYNDQPWKFLMCDRETHTESYQKIFDSLAEGNQKWVKNVPMLMVSIAGSHYHKTGKPNRFGQFDTGAAALSLCLQAVDLGLMAHQMGGFDHEKIQKDFAIPKGYTPMSVIAVGYEKENPEDYPLAHERFEVKETFYLGSFGNGFE